ncbi:unnamed protein product [Brassica oleracea var. botrytis]|uniref:Uncharacterized protein n=3 Tax=Brassica TaxID=3705 RepID=A0A0D3DI27_BRAOL|nr:unnamed protein product [Brassica napus]VDD41067.1 unnamed protein product [Brassica oleracea]
MYINNINTLQSISEDTLNIGIFSNFVINGVFDALGVKERGQLIYEDIEDYLNQRKQHLNKLQRMLNIGICVNVAVTPVTSNPENSGPPIISRIIKAHIPNYTHPKPK